MKTKPKPHKKPRPQIEQSVAHVSRCKKCGSTRRAPYHGRKELSFAGLDKDAQPYTHVVWRRTACLDCGQARVDRVTENRPQTKKRK